MVTGVSEMGIFLSSISKLNISLCSTESEATASSFIGMKALL